MSVELLTLLAVLAALGALSACGAEDTDRAAPATPTRSSGDLLSDLQAQANQLLDGGPYAFRARLAELRGHPVVASQWASWCGPCRFEFPFFSDLARRHEGLVVFLGVNSRDSREERDAFLRELPVPFPHYFEPHASVARVFRGGQAWPTTAFYDAAGELAYTRQRQGRSKADLEADIRGYALRG
jgi:cytochrome c biogenesis protein CcmG/thiol:disulfide interchange protein DsbE